MFSKRKKNPNNPDASLAESYMHVNLRFNPHEQYKLLRTNLRFTLPQDVKCPVIGVTSSVRGEGKSTTAVNLAYVLAEQGGKVLLIDGDLRLPTIAKKLQIKNENGLTEQLVSRGELEIEPVQFVRRNWFVLPSGKIPPNPSELLSSKMMENFLNKMRTMCSYVVVDLPPVNIVSDSLSVSKFLDGMIVVVRKDYTTKNSLDQCIRQLKLVDANVLGFLLNSSEEVSGSYSKYGKKNKYYEYGTKYGNASK